MTENLIQESGNTLTWLNDGQVGEVEVWNKTEDGMGFGSANFEGMTGFTGRSVQLLGAGARGPGSKMTDGRSTTPELLPGVGERERLPGALVGVGCRWGSDGAGALGLPRKVSRLAR